MAAAHRCRWWFVGYAFADPPGAVALPAGTPHDFLRLAIYHHLRPVFATIRIVRRDVARSLGDDWRRFWRSGTTSAGEYEAHDGREWAHGDLPVFVASDAAARPRCS